MTEARILCVCKEIRVADLKLVLREGDVVWLDRDVAARSRDLAFARRAGAVQVRWATRCEVSKPPQVPARPVPPWLQRLRGAVAPSRPDVEDVARRAAEEAAALSSETFRAIVREEIRSALIGLPGTGPTTVVSPRTTTAPAADVPVFIPTNIVPTEEATISVSAETTGASGVDDASAALKAARGGSRRKSTKES